MGAISFVPGWGWIAGGIYFGADIVTKLSTGKSIVEHLDAAIEERYDIDNGVLLEGNMIDYIFYRVYWAYNKKRESAKFLSPLYMAMVFAFLFFPFALFLCELLRDSYHRNDGYLLSIYLLMILIYSYLRFFPNKKIWLINKKFEGNGYNYKIPDWCFFVVLPLSIVWGIITYSLLVNFLIKPFALRGIIYNML